MLSVIFGLVGIVVGVLWLAIWGAWSQFVTVFVGAVPPFMVLVGLVAVAAGVSSIKDNMAAKKEEEKLGDESSSTESSDSSSEASSKSDSETSSESSKEEKPAE